MPLAAIVDNKFFAVHAGIGPDIRTINDIDKVKAYIYYVTPRLISPAKPLYRDTDQGADVRPVVVRSRTCRG